MAGTQSRLEKILKPYEQVGIAFSGGVDSSFLLAMAVQLLGASKVLAITVKSPYIPQWEVAEAIAFAKTLGVNHLVVPLDGVPEEIQSNPKDRCYRCKKIVFAEIWKVAKDSGCDVLCDGTNADDLSDYRPGLKALKELDVLSPLMLAQYTKLEIREGLKALGLEIWDKPPYACLLTRVPYDVAVTPQMLVQIESAELSLMQRGIRGVRVRHHGNIARIEVQREELHKFYNLEEMTQINEEIKALGFEFVTLDLGGYQSGCYNVHVVSLREQEETDESK